MRTIGFVLDMRTIGFVNLITDVACVWFVVILWRQNRDRFAGTTFWVFDFLFQVVALVLIVLRGVIPDWMSMVLSNTMVIAGSILGLMGLERFLGKRGPQIHNCLLLILFIFVHCHFALIDPSLAARNLNLSAVLFLVCFQCLWLLWRRVRPGLRSLTFGLGAVFFLYCLVSVLRIIQFFVGTHTENNYFQSGTFEALVLVTYQVLFILLTYSLVLMVNKRLLLEINTREEEFTKAFQSSPYAITLTRQSDGTIIDVNETFVSITGYDRAEVMGKKTIDLHLLERHELEKRVVERTEELRHINEKLQAEITERKQAEEKIRKNVAELKEAQHLAQVGSWNWTAKTDTVAWSEELYRIAGRDPSLPALSYRDHPNLYSPESMERLDKAVRLAMETGTPYELEMELIRMDDRTSRLLVARGEAIRDETGCIIGLHGTVQDITERKRVEATVQNLYIYNRTLIEANIEPLVTIDRDGKISDVNSATEQMTGHLRHELIGTDFSDYFTEPEKAREGYRFVFKTGQVRDYPLEIRHRAGHITSVLYNATVYHDHSGNILGVFASAHDITGRKELESRLHRAEKMESIGTLAGGVAHDLNNLLGAMIGNAEILIADMGKTDPRRKSAEKIMAIGEHAAAEIQDLLTMARRGVVLKEPASLNKIVTDHLNSPEIGKLLSSHPDVVIETKYEPDLPDIEASAIHIESILTNLIANALHAIPVDGKISIGTENRRLEGPLMGYEAVPKGEYAVLTVSDTGMGIFPEYIKNLFEPFFMRKVLKKGGSGLGLSVIWGAMKDHDGYIDVTSESGRGTTFSLYFPMT
jgi:PAS domain S-box-containing protein